MTTRDTTTIILASILAVASLLMGMVITSCSDVSRAHLTAMGSASTVELYSGGRVVATFESTGKVNCTEGGICDFMDKASGKLVRTTGDIVIKVK